MKNGFSFKYGENKYAFTVEANAPQELEKGVYVTAIPREYAEYNAVEWVVYFENKSDKNSEIFSQVNDCDTLLPLEIIQKKRPGYIPKAGDPCVITMKGTVNGAYYWSNDEVSASEFNFLPEYLTDEPKSFENREGRSSYEMMPFFDVTSLGCGYITAVGWSGDWRSKFTRCENGIRMETGLKYTNFYLKPGERIRTTSTLIMEYTDSEDKYNKFRRLIKDHFSHKSTTAARESLMAFELWGGLTHQEMIKRINELKKHDIRFEDIWIDAGWYGNCLNCESAFEGDWWEHTGDWTPNPRTQPEKFKDVNNAVRNAGMKLMLWFEPERAIKNLPVPKKHPEWFIERPGDGSLILNYGNEEAKEYIRNLILGYIQDLDLSCYRQDFNVDISYWFAAADEEDRRGITEIKHICGMYEIWDYLLEKAPNIIIDNCASGGRRIDIETLKRSIPFFRSDYQCNFNETPEVLQVHNSNISHYLPYNGCTSKTKNDTYAIRSSYSSSWGGAFYNTIFQSMDEDDFKWAKKITDEYRSIRRYFTEDFYNHGSKLFDDTSWAIWQYHDDKDQSGIVMAFRRENSPFENVKIELKGLNGDEYLFENLNDGSAYASKKTVNINLDRRSSVIIKYSKIR